ncbi:uncharacterized protein LOC109020774 [Juglans regia]|uniref:Uncharacterized protein LOC109020774 n=1 Tax=Juglans regia TaxID=51240 RepID=A0A6P9EKU8_JUGRE|nr:uncharacterized protein LOC109020774 [Juglans regia]
MQIQVTTNNQNTQVINDLRGTINKMSTTLSTLEKGKFPSQPQPNPQVYRKQQQQVHNVLGKVFETAKAVLTLRSGKEVPQPEMTIDKQVVAPTPEDVTETDEAEKEPEVVRPESKKPMSADAKTSRGYQPVVPYPQKLASSQKNKYHTEIQEIFKQDLCTVKRKLNVKKKVFPTKQVSALILSETPQKFGDPGSPHIFIMIGESCIGRALLDLGSSVNLLPFSVYEQLGLGELKKTSIKLQLADRLVKMPRGIVENVLVQQPTTTIYQALVIFGRPFLSTSNTLINCRSGMLKLTFENMTLEINVFNTCKMPGDCDESEVHAVEEAEILMEGAVHYKEGSSSRGGRHCQPKNGNSFTVNGQRLKPFLKVFDPHEEILLVQDSRKVF